MRDETDDSRVCSIVPSPAAAAGNRCATTSGGGPPISRTPLILGQSIVIPRSFDAEKDHLRTQARYRPRFPHHPKWQRYGSITRQLHTLPLMKHPPLHKPHVSSGPV